jgi:hypothetical protein
MLHNGELKKLQSRKVKTMKRVQKKYFLTYRTREPNHFLELGIK